MDSYKDCSQNWKMVQGIQGCPRISFLYNCVNLCEATTKTSTKFILNSLVLFTVKSRWVVVTRVFKDLNRKCTILPKKSELPCILDNKTLKSFNLYKKTCFSRSYKAYYETEFLSISIVGIWHKKIRRLELILYTTKSGELMQRSDNHSVLHANDENSRFLRKSKVKHSSELNIGIIITGDVVIITNALFTESVCGLISNLVSYQFWFSLARPLAPSTLMVVLKDLILSIYFSARIGYKLSSNEIIVLTIQCIYDIAKYKLALPTVWSVTQLGYHTMVQLLTGPGTQQQPL